MNDFKIFVSAHCAATVVFFTTDDVDLAHIERIGSTDNGTNIKIVFDIFDGDFKTGAFFVQGFKNLLIFQTFVLID